jgi:methylase of polypeptide subunit release factors
MEVGTGSGIPITFLVQKLLQQADTYKAIKEDDISNTTSIRAIATDLNPAALRLAQRTAQQNGIFVVDRTDDGNGDGHEEGKQGDYEHLEALATGHTERRGCRRHKIQMEFVQCDLATPFLSTLENQVDCLIFNPPYVPTPDSEVVNVHVDQNDDDNGDSCTPMSRRSGDDVDDKLIEASWAGGERGRRVIDRFMFSQLPKLLSKPHGVAYLVTVDDNQPHELSCILLEQYNLQMRPLVRRRARNEYLTIQKITWSET